MFDRIKEEPALVSGAIAALIAVAVGFGLDWTPEQVSLVNAAVIAVMSIFTRSRVTPVDGTPTG